MNRLVATVDLATLLTEVLKSLTPTEQTASLALQKGISSSVTGAAGSESCRVRPNASALIT